MSTATKIEWTRSDDGSGHEPKGGDWDAWPADLRVREFPGPAAASPLGVTGAGS